MLGNATFADRSLTVHGQRFHLTDWGPADAPTVLFLHGVTGHARTWDHEAAALAGRFRIIALDQRGHGDSDPAPDGGYTWKYDRAIRDAVRNGRWREDLDVWPLWASVACPTVIVRGAESDVLSPETAKQMVDARPRARLVEIPDAGHTVPGDQPAQFLDVLRAFLTS